MDDCSIQIGLTRNGFEVMARDPKIDEANAKSKSEYKTPWVTYAFTSKEQALEFIEDALDIVKPRKSQENKTFDAAFAEAVSGVESDTDTDDSDK